MSPFCFCVRNYYVTFDKKTLAKIYAAKFLAKNEVLWVAEEMYSIMEESIQYDNTNGQELTKEFLVDIIEIMNDIDAEYTGKITAEYLKLTMEMAGVKK